MYTESLWDDSERGDRSTRRGGKKNLYQCYFVHRKENMVFNVKTGGAHSYHCTLKELRE